MLEGATSALSLKVSAGALRCRKGKAPDGGTQAALTKARARHRDQRPRTAGIRIVYRQWPEGYDPLRKGERPIALPLLSCWRPLSGT